MPVAAAGGEPSGVVVRAAAWAEGDSLAELDRASWTSLTSPAPTPEPHRPFFDERTVPADVLVALVDGALAGYVRLGRATPLKASDHVLTVNGLAVEPAYRRRGVGRALLEAAVAEARSRGARRLTLRVLGHNSAARRLYAQAGFVVEGVRQDEFELDGRYVDDVFMALDLTLRA